MSVACAVSLCALKICMLLEASVFCGGSLCALERLCTRERLCVTRDDCLCVMGRVFVVGPVCITWGRFESLR